MIPRRGAVAALLAVAAAALGGAAAAAPAGAAGDGVQLSAAFGPGAVLGGPTSLQIGLRVDPQRRPAPVEAMRLLYPRSLGVVSSGLGLEACERPASQFVQVIVHGRGLDGCPPNAVMAYGSAVAEVRLSDGQVIPEYATLSLLSGPIEDGLLRLVLWVDGLRPFGGRLLIGGRASEAGGSYGGGLDFVLPRVPALEGMAEIAVVDMQLTVGDPRIRYRERVRGGTIAYRPEGVALPSRCPRGGFRFRIELAFRDGARANAVATAPCPPRRR